MEDDVRHRTAGSELAGEPRRPARRRARLRRYVARAGTGRPGEGGTRRQPGGRTCPVRARDGGSGHQLDGLHGRARGRLRLRRRRPARFGWSPPPATMAGLLDRALAATVIKLIEQRRRGPVHLVGNSMGGLIAVELAASRPDLVRTLTLISPALPDPLIRRRWPGSRCSGMPKVGDWLLRRSGVFPARGTGAGGRWTRSSTIPAPIHPERLRQAVAEMERRDAARLRRTSHWSARRGRSPASTCARNGWPTTPGGWPRPSPAPCWPSTAATTSS